MFLDIIIRNVSKKQGRGEDEVAIGILYEERLVDGRVEFVPIVEKIGDLDGFYAHREIDAKGQEVYNEHGEQLKVNNENVFVIMNNEKISLLPK